MKDELPTIGVDDIDYTKWTPEQMQQEVEKCRNSPYYFVTHYWRANGKKFTTPLTEEEFNKQWKDKNVTLIRGWEGHRR